MEARDQLLPLNLSLLHRRLSHVAHLFGRFVYSSRFHLLIGGSKSDGQHKTKWRQWHFIAGSKSFWELTQPWARRHLHSDGGTRNLYQQSKHPAEPPCTCCTSLLFGFGDVAARHTEPFGTFGTSVLCQRKVFFSGHLIWLSLCLVGFWSVFTLKS